MVDPVFAINSMMAKAKQQDEVANKTEKNKKVTSLDITSIQQKIVDKYAQFFNYMDKIDQSLEKQLKLVEKRVERELTSRIKDEKRAKEKAEKDQEALRYGRTQLASSVETLSGNRLASAVEAAVMPARPNLISTIPGATPINGPTQVYVPEIETQVNVNMGPHRLNQENNAAIFAEKFDAKKPDMSQQIPAGACAYMGDSEVHDTAKDAQHINEIQEELVRNSCNLNQEHNCAIQSANAGQTEVLVSPSVEVSATHPINNNYAPKDNFEQMANHEQVSLGGNASQGGSLEQKGAIPIQEQPNDVLDYELPPSDIPYEAVGLVDETYVDVDHEDEVDIENSRTFTGSELPINGALMVRREFDKTSYENTLLGIKRIMKAPDYLHRVKDDYTELLLTCGLQEIDMSVLGVSEREMLSKQHWIIHLPQESQYLCSRSDYVSYVGSLFSKALGFEVSVELRFENVHGMLPKSPLALAHIYYDEHFKDVKKALIEDSKFNELVTTLGLDVGNGHFDLISSK